MKLLLDTHAFLWFVLNEPKLSKEAKEAIVNPSSDVFVSPASFWELAIKISLGKYLLHVPFEQFLLESIDGNCFQLLPIEALHAVAVSQLPFHHRDPFDRMLIAQALVEQATIVSADSAFDAYPIARVW